MPSKSSEHQYAEGIEAYESRDGRILTADLRLREIVDNETGRVTKVPINHYGFALQKIVRENPQEWGEVGVFAHLHPEGAPSEQEPFKPLVKPPPSPAKQMADAVAAGVTELTKAK